MLHISMLLISLVLSAQDDLTLTGTVFDPSGARVSGAQIVLLNTTDRTRQETTTAADGTYRLEKLPEGSYSVEVTRDTFFPVRTEIRLDASASLEFTLSPNEAIKEHVEVVGRPEPISMDTVSSEQSINDAAIQNLPYAGERNFINALTLLPDVIQDNK